jgi:hypothetical protein
MRKPSFVLMLALCLCCGKGLGTTVWESDVCRLSADLKLTAAGQDRSPGWSACRAGFFPGVNGSPDLFILELMTPNSRGSFLERGAGWLVIDLNGEQAPGHVIVSRQAGGSDPANLAAGNAGVIYYPAGAASIAGTGSLTLNAFTLSADGLDVDVTLDVQFAAATSGPSYALTGAASGVVQPRPSGPQGPTGCADSGKSCADDPTVSAWKRTCSNGGIGPCHCAAAATYACFYSHGCYAEAGAATSVTQSTLAQGCQTELATAAQTNTPCGISCPR